MRQSTTAKKKRRPTGDATASTRSGRLLPIVSRGGVGKDNVRQRHSTGTDRAFGGPPGPRTGRAAANDGPAAAEPTDPPAKQIADSLGQLLAIVDSGQRPADVLRANTVAVAKPAGWSAADVRGLRDRMGASQAVFADLLHVSVELVQHWEQGVRPPRGPALRLLDVASTDPAGFLAGLVRRMPAAG